MGNENTPKKIDPKKLSKIEKDTKESHDGSSENAFPNNSIQRSATHKKGGFVERLLRSRGVNIDLPDKKL